MSRRGARQLPIHRRSRSVHHFPPPYQVITETYTKETTTRPFDECRTATPDTVIYRGNHNPNQNLRKYPVIRVDSPVGSKYSEIYREVLDYETYSKNDGIALRKPLPEYNEYINSRNIPCDENQNSIPISRPIPRPRSKSPLPPPQKAPRGHIRSISSETDQRYVYTHDVYVDSKTGRPFTPGRETDKNGPRLKINVYFKPEGVEPIYTLDEIEIAKEDCGLISSKNNSFSQNGSFEQKPIANPRHSRPQSCSSILRKESEIVQVPINLASNEVCRESSRIESELRSSINRPPTRASECHSTQIHGTPVRKESQVVQVPINLASNEICRESSRIDSELRSSINRPPTRASECHSTQIQGTAVRKESEIRTTSSEINEVFRQSTRSSEINRNEPCQQSTRASEIINEEYRKLSRCSEVNRNTTPIQECKPIENSRTPSERTITIERIEESSIDMDLIFPKCPPTNVRPPSRSTICTVPLAIEEKFEDPIPCRSPSLQRGIPKTDYTDRSSSCAIEEKFDHREPIECKPTIIPGYQPNFKYPPQDYHDKSTKYERTEENIPKSQKPNTTQKGSPIEEIIHIKEKYEKDETIRRFYPTTTTV
ncbi:unnamed protein product [Caenorhabditis angaria]|uniref:Uncharacterized protein n=1 Tax=Caenorhabditis angaria TaxID=860376 RepID=A0A9P1IBI4_9PELO|nr:unnamed protein product [Caenorhabditis angaria]